VLHRALRMWVSIKKKKCRDGGDSNESTTSPPMCPCPVISPPPFADKYAQRTPDRQDRNGEVSLFPSVPSPSPRCGGVSVHSLWFDFSVRKPPFFFFFPFYFPLRAREHQSAAAGGGDWRVLSETGTRKGKRALVVSLLYLIRSCFGFFLY